MEGSVVGLDSGLAVAGRDPAEDKRLGAADCVEGPARALTSILVTVPVFQSVYPRPFKNFLGLAFSTHSEAARYKFSVHIPERQLLHDAMNRTFSGLLETDNQAVIIADDDCFPPIDAISKLLRHFEAGHDIVCGMGYMRNPPYTTTVGRYYPEGPTVVKTGEDHYEFAGFHWLDSLRSDSGLVEADFCGFPIAMISRRAIQRIEQPWFGTWIDGGSCTHDVYFGAKAKKAGLKILVDTSIDCGHLTDAPVITGQARDFARKAHTALKTAGVSA